MWRICCKHIIIACTIFGGKWVFIKLVWIWIRVFLNVNILIHIRRITFSNATKRIHSQIYYVCSYQLCFIHIHLTLTTHSKKFCLSILNILISSACDFITLLEWVFTSCNSVSLLQAIEYSWKDNNFVVCCRVIIMQLRQLFLMFLFGFEDNGIIIKTIELKSCCRSVH